MKSSETAEADHVEVQAELQRPRHDPRQDEEFLEGLPDAVVVVDLQTNLIVALNHMTTIVMGFTQEDVAAGLVARRLAPPDEFKRMGEMSVAFIRRGLPRV